MCGCINVINAKLKEADLNTMLDIPIAWSADGVNAGDVLIATKKRDKNNRKKPSSLFASYCPFCGEPYKKRDALHPPELISAAEASDATASVIRSFSGHIEAIETAAEFLGDAIQDVKDERAARIVYHKDAILVIRNALRALLNTLEGAKGVGDGNHRGDPCEFCGTPHDDVAVGDCPGYPADGEGGRSL